MHRPWNYYGCARKLKVIIDGDSAGGDGAGKTKSFDVTDAVHTVQVSMDWVKSVPIQVDATSGSEVKVDVEFARFPMIMLNTFVAPSKVFFLRSDSEFRNPSPYPRD